MIDFLRTLGRDDTGATAVEYGLILALVFLAMVGAVASVGTETIKMWEFVRTEVLTSTNASG